jgi:hypothetical protein
MNSKFVDKTVAPIDAPGTGARSSASAGALSATPALDRNLFLPQRTHFLALFELRLRRIDRKIHF